MDFAQQTNAKCYSYTSFQGAICGKPKKFNPSKNSADTYDTRARNMMQMRVLEEASGPKQNFASAACSAMKRTDHYALRFL